MALAQFAPEENVHELRIRTVLGRLELIIDNENQRLGADPKFDLKTSNTQKSRCLYELTLLFRDTGPQHLPPSFLQQMRYLKEKLAVNARKLEAHLDAVRSVTDILRSAAQEAEGDGTYCQEQFRYSEF